MPAARTIPPPEAPPHCGRARATAASSHTRTSVKVASCCSPRENGRPVERIESRAHSPAPGRIWSRTQAGDALDLRKRLLPLGLFVMGKAPLEGGENLVLDRPRMAMMKTKPNRAI